MALAVDTSTYTGLIYTAQNVRSEAREWCPSNARGAHVRCSPQVIGASLLASLAPSQGGGGFTKAPPPGWFTIRHHVRMHAAHSIRARLSAAGLRLRGLGAALLRGACPLGRACSAPHGRHGPSLPCRHIESPQGPGPSRPPGCSHFKPQLSSQRARSTRGTHAPQLLTTRGGIRARACTPANPRTWRRVST